MKTTLVDIAVGITIFILGIALTVRRYGTKDRLAFTLVAILSPFVAIVTLIRLPYLSLTGQLSIDPCPEGLEEAEKIVELQRQSMFGGPLREPLFTASWKLAYERELQIETERIQRLARRYLAVA